MADQQQGPFAPNRLLPAEFVGAPTALARQCSRLPEADRRFPVADLYLDGYSA